MRIAVVLGTRPEIIKLAPVVHSLRDLGLQTSVLYTGQHAEAGSNLCDTFGLEAENLNVVGGNDLNERLAEQISALNVHWCHSPADLVIVQGDTSSCLAGALAAANRAVPVAHIEAGLRTSNRRAPFPEEQFRRLVTQVADLHFAPTEEAKQNLLSVGVPAREIHVVGNTGIDSCRMVFESLFGQNEPKRVPRVVVTTHRRESWTVGLGNVILASSLLADRFPKFEVVVIRHPHPDWQKRIPANPTDSPNWSLSDPLTYTEMIEAISTSHLLITDSGGLQEEASFLGTPTLVTRAESDRPESFRSPHHRLVGTNTDNIVREASKVMKTTPSFTPSFVFGDGFARNRIAGILQGYSRQFRASNPLGLKDSEQSLVEPAP